MQHAVLDAIERQCLIHDQRPRQQLHDQPRHHTKLPAAANLHASSGGSAVLWLRWVDRSATAADCVQEPHLGCKHGTVRQRPRPEQLSHVERRELAQRLYTAAAAAGCGADAPMEGQEDSLSCRQLYRVTQICQQILFRCLLCCGCLVSRRILLGAIVVVSRLWLRLCLGFCVLGLLLAALGRLVVNAFRSTHRLRDGCVQPSGSLQLAPCSSQQQQ